MPLKEENIHLVAAGPKRCCSCKNDRPCDCGCVCEDMTYQDDSGSTPTTEKQENPDEDCYKAMQFNNYNYSDDPGQPTCQDPYEDTYEDPFVGPKAPCWMFVAKDCGDHVMCTEEEALTLCDSPTKINKCGGDVVPPLDCYECPCTCETVSKASGMAEGIFYNTKDSCEEARVDDDPGHEDCDKCVEVPFPEGENGSLCNDLRSNYINCAGNSACLGQQEGTSCWMIVDKTCADLGSGCVDNPETKGIRCEPSSSESDCPALQNCWSSCPNGTFVSEDDCDQHLEDMDDDAGCFKCEPCNFDEETDCWCLAHKSCEDLHLYDGETNCDNDRVSFGCEGGGGTECATCKKSDECIEESPGLDCYELVATSCSSIGGSYSNKADCDEALVADSSNRCYKCYRITDCDDCWSSMGRGTECWGVRPMNCSEIGGMSGAECEQAIEDADEDAFCLKCVDQNCPETENCFKLETKTCAEICRDDECCQEFCDEELDSKECSILSGQPSESRCPDCVECHEKTCPVCISDVTIHAVVNIFVSGTGATTYGGSGGNRTVPFEFKFNHALDTRVNLGRSINSTRCSGICGSTWEGVDFYTAKAHDFYQKWDYAPGVTCPQSGECFVITECFGATVINGNVSWDTGCAPGNDVCPSGMVYHESKNNPPGCTYQTDESNCAYSFWNFCEETGDYDDHIEEWDCSSECGVGQFEIGAGVDFCADTGELMRVSVGSPDGRWGLDTEPGGHPLGFAYSINDYITVSQVPMYLSYGYPEGANSPGTIGGSAQIDVIYHTYTAPDGGCPE